MLEVGQYQPIAAVSTAFTFGDHRLVTCWHCVSTRLEDNHFYGIPYGKDMGLPDQVAILDHIHQAASGADLALATIQYSDEPKIRLASAATRWGRDVVSLGFPHPENTIDPETTFPISRTQSRALKRYVSSAAEHATRGTRACKCYELGMPVPLWSSGSPWFDAETLQVVGVLAGERTSVVGLSREFTVELAIHLPPLKSEFRKWR